ncbi:MAG: hypothetical protein ACO3MW_11870 [Rhodospirillales bacterium]
MSVDPSLAGDPSNLITLCAKRCHITVGHFGNWRTFNPLCATQCFLAYQRP